MLLEMRIENFILIESLNLEFSKGLNVFTGETGAGKSMIIGAINAGLGGKVSADQIRSGANKALIQLVFSVEAEEIIKVLHEIGIDLEDDLVIITREIHPSNRSVVRLNDRVITLSTLKQLSDVLIDIHGQHEHQTLLYPKNHLKYLDLMGSTDHMKLMDLVESSYLHIKKLQHEIQELINSGNADVDVNYLKFQIDEIDALQLTTEDENSLEEKFEYYKNLETIFQNTHTVLQVLGGEDDTTNGIKEMIQSSIKFISDIASFDPKLENYLQQLNDVLYQIDDLQSEFRHYIDGLDVDESEMYEVEQRMNAINELKLKHGRTVADIILKRNILSEQLNQAIHRDEFLNEMNKKIQDAKKIYILQSKELQKSRLKLKTIFETSVLEELSLLNMKTCQFEVAFKETTLGDGEYRLSPNGFDSIEFIISTNPGMDLKPLVKIASGGEISRIMLAIKIALSHHDVINTLVFDEVDTGISGGTAIIVGEKIHKITNDYQVICITHLPQIAIMGDYHFLISKSVDDGLGITHVHHLDDKQKLMEIARMLSGDDQSLTAKQNAKEMLEKAHQYKSIS
ncbi:MAG: DNA repair protein RecN [Clostridiales bacterium]|nr:DNA repair protein RecN [Clostridiales bacterium]